MLKSHLEDHKSEILRRYWKNRASTASNFTRPNKKRPETAASLARAFFVSPATMQRFVLKYAERFGFHYAGRGQSWVRKTRKQNVKIVE